VAIVRHIALMDITMDITKGRWQARSLNGHGIG
jgi:hypothetical protein